MKLPFLVAGFLTASSLAGAQISVNDNIVYKIKNVNSGLVLGLSGASQAASTNVVQWEDNGTQDHLWHFIPNGNNQYVIENMLTHQVIGVQNASKANGAQILQYADNGTADHLWTVNNAGDGNYYIKNVNSGLYMEDAYANRADTATIDQYASTGCNCQEWQLVSTGNAPYVSPGPVSGNGLGVNDPNIVRDGNGTYWLTGTHNFRASSPDRKAFTTTGSALNPVPGYVTTYNGSADPWAPAIVYANGTYRQYFSGSRFGSSYSTIGLATASSPNSGSWQDQGQIVSSPQNSTTFNAIDPAPFQDANGNWWMMFGSFSNGINILQLNNSTGQRISSNSTITQLATRPGGEEGSQGLYHNGYYYLFASANPCCQGNNTTYRIIVGRATSVTGPYYDRGGLDMRNGGGTILLSAHGNINGPGGESIFTDSDGTILVYHYYDGNNNGAPTLGINKIGWTSDNWPYVM